MKVKVVFKISGTERALSTNSVKMPETYKVKEEKFECCSVEELFTMFPPLKLSENLQKAAQGFLKGERMNITYNFGKGNSTFYAV